MLTTVVLANTLEEFEGLILKINSISNIFEISVCNNKFALKVLLFGT